MLCFPYPHFRDVTSYILYSTYKLSMIVLYILRTSASTAHLRAKRIHSFCSTLLRRYRQAPRLIASAENSYVSNRIYTSPVPQDLASWMSELPRNSRSSTRLSPSPRRHLISSIHGRRRSTRGPSCTSSQPQSPKCERSSPSQGDVVDV